MSEFNLTESSFIRASLTVFENFMHEHFFLRDHHSFNMSIHKIFRNTNISHTLIHTRTCAYQGARKASFSENFAYVLTGWSLNMQVFCLQFTKNELHYLNIICNFPKFSEKILLALMSFPHFWDCSFEFRLKNFRLMGILIIITTWNQFGLYRW